MREVGGYYGQSYRIHPDDPRMVQVKPGHRRRWKLFRECDTAAEALAVRDGMGRLIPSPDLPDWAKEEPNG